MSTGSCPCENALITMFVVLGTQQVTVGESRPASSVVIEYPANGSSSQKMFTVTPRSEGMVECCRAGSFPNEACRCGSTLQLTANKIYSQRRSISSNEFGLT